MKVRRYRQGEERALWLLLYETVHKVNSKDYSQSQIEAWAPSNWNLSEWENRLNKTNPFVVEENGRAIGFAELEEDGHIDCFYCAHDRQGMGVGSLLLEAIELEASKRGTNRLFAEVSITAKGFFEKNGFSVEKEQVVALRGERFINYMMSKHIS